ncbi:MAG: OmpA family protein, partial [candidate division WOR-3 bacterium]
TRRPIPKMQATAGTILIIGHTYNGPVPASLRQRYPTNWDLGAARAAAVAKAIAAWGVSASRIRVVSAAGNEPLSPGNTPADRANNNRVQILIFRH